jgi:hypothetical protein
LFDDKSPSHSIGEIANALIDATRVFFPQADVLLLFLMHGSDIRVADNPAITDEKRIYQN